MALSPRRRGQVPVLTPPAAVAEHQFLELCARCDACDDACPYESVTLAPERFKAAAGTPMIDAFQAPCPMCEDTPCISAHSSTVYTVCEERCPVDGAIVLDGGRPRIIDEYCTGCGVCHHDHARTEPTRRN